jgi:hypothetical protein
LVAGPDFLGLAGYTEPGLMTANTNRPAFPDLRLPRSLQIIAGRLLNVDDDDRLHEQMLIA